MHTQYPSSSDDQTKLLFNLNEIIEKLLKILKMYKTVIRPILSENEIFAILSFNVSLALSVRVLYGRKCSCKVDVWKRCDVIFVPNGNVVDVSIRTTNITSKSLF